MSEVLCSVGLDVGTTSTQMVVSRLVVENRASAFTVPELEIAQREILYQSPIHFTPLLDEARMDAAALRQLVEAEYRAAGICREQVDTGAIIITGETSRKENAEAVLNALSDLAGNFVVTAAGPDLESVLAAKGAGAVDYSTHTGKTVLHIDIGGGTSNLALIRAGKITATGCMNVGGRLVKLDGERITYVSPVLKKLWTPPENGRLTKEQGQELANLLASALEMAAGLRPPTSLLEALTTTEAKSRLPLNEPGEKIILSFSGGVADCIEQEKPWQAFGDLGVLLGQAIRKSALCRNYVLGSQTIRATVIGAGCHSAQLSGSTVFCQNVRFPLKNIPAAVPDEAGRFEETVFLTIPGLKSPHYAEISQLAEQLLARHTPPLYLCIEQDMAKALGQALAVRLGRNAEILCIDRIKVSDGSFLDVGVPVGPAFPVVVKTLVLGMNN